jgi:two-component system cell cycle sensor histidine kinase/response regulator CckA
VNKVSTSGYQKLDRAPALPGLPSDKPIPGPDWCGELPVGRGKTLLLVDDEEAIRQIGKELLEDMGFQVLLAKDGQEAVEVYRRKEGEIDIVLLDIMMPNMNGSEAYDRLKAMNPNVKVLLWSGANVNDVAAQMLKRGCNGFIQKPFSIHKLRNKIGQILGTQTQF